MPKAAIEDYGEDVASNAIEVLIHRLRKRMQDAHANVRIPTLRGTGYMLTHAPTRRVRAPGVRRLKALPRQTSLPGM